MPEPPANPNPITPQRKNKGSGLTLAQIESIAKGAASPPAAPHVPAASDSGVSIPTPRQVPITQKVIQPVAPEPQATDVPTEQPLVARPVKAIAPMNLPTIEAPPPPPPPKPAPAAPKVTPPPVASQAQPVSPVAPPTQPVTTPAVAPATVSVVDAKAMSTPPPVPPPVVAATPPKTKKHRPHLIGTPRTKPLDELTAEKAVTGSFGASSTTIYIVRKMLLLVLLGVGVLAIWLSIKSGLFNDWFNENIVTPIKNMSQP